MNFDGNWLSGFVREIVYQYQDLVHDVYTGQGKITLSEQKF